MNCADIQSILATEPLEILEQRERTLLQLHLKDCQRCAVQSREVEEAYQWLGDSSEEQAFDPEALWGGIQKRLKEDSGKRESSKKLVIQTKKIVIALSCSFCHDSLLRAEAAYCASCLAPHHGDCFRAHGRCSALGCEETLTVKPMSPELEDTPRRSHPVRTRSSRLFIGIVTLLSVGTLSTAALVGFGYFEAQKLSEQEQRAAALIAKSELQKARALAERAFREKVKAERAREIQEFRRRAEQEAQKAALLKARSDRKDIESVKNQKVRALRDLRSKSIDLERALKEAYEKEAKMRKLSKDELEFEKERFQALERVREALEQQQLELRQQVQELMAKMPPIEIWKSRYEHEILDFSVDNEPFQSALLRLEKQVDLSLDASQFKASPKISYVARNKPWQEVLEDLARKAGAELDWVSPRCITLRKMRLLKRALPAQSRQQRIVEMGRRLGWNIVVCPDILGREAPMKEGQALLPEFERITNPRQVYRQGDTIIVSAKKLRLPLWNDSKIPVHPFVMRTEVTSLTTVKTSGTLAALVDRVSHESGGRAIRVLSERNPKLELRVRKVTWRELLLLIARKSRMKIFESPDLITLVDADSVFVEAIEAPLPQLLKAINQLKQRQIELGPNVKGHVSVSIRSNSTQSVLSALCEAFELSSKRTKKQALIPFVGSIVSYTKSTPKRAKIQKSKFEDSGPPLGGKPVGMMLQAVLGQRDPQSRRLTIITGRIYKEQDPILRRDGSRAGFLRVGSIEKSSVRYDWWRPNGNLQRNISFSDLWFPRSF